MKQTKVAANLQQDFSEQEKNQARINIGAAASAALNYEILRAENAETAAKSEVLAGTGISVTNTLAQDGHTIYTVSNSGDSLYKRLQNSIDQPYADYAFIRNLRQTPNGEVSIECSYISAATDTVTGLMSSSDKSKLDGIQNGAQVNQYAWSNLQVGNTLIQADSATDTLTVSAGNNITLTPDASSDSLTISATDTTYSAGSGLTLSGTEFSVDTTTIQEKLTAGSNITINGTTISSTDTDTHRPIQVNGTQNLGDNTTPLNLKAGSNVTLTANGGDVTIAAASAPSQVNADWTATSGPAEILNKPNLATVATSGSYNDLSNTPNLATVATSGSYTDLSNTPTIPTVNDGTLTIQVNGTQLATFSANQSSNVTANITGVGGTDVVTRTNGQGGYVEHPVSKLTLDTDFQQILTDGTEVGVYAPTPVVAVTDKVLTVTAGSDVPLWLDRPNLPTVEYIQFNYSNTTTAQDDVYAAIAAAYTNGKLPVLTCNVAGGALYWVPTATGQTGYAFARHTSTTCSTAEFDHTLHILTLSSKSIVDYTAGTNISIDANNQISATDTTYSAGSYININSNNVISNTMHLDTAGLMISYNTLSNAGVTTHSWGPWRLQITKKAMATWDDGTGTDPSVLVQVAHSDYISGTITNGRVQHINYYPWKDGVMDQVYTGHVQWAFTGAYAQGGSNNGFPIDLTSPLDPDGNARACPRSMRALHLIYNCGIDSPDWLDINIEPLYVNNNTSLNTNAARLLIRAKYFYV